MTKVTKLLDAKAGASETKRARYYQIVNAYLLSRAARTTNDRDKQILEYLHTRLVTVSKGLLTSATPGITVVSSPAPAVTEVKNPVVLIPVTTETPVVSAPMGDISALGIDFANPIFAGYDFTLDKRFPRNITNFLDTEVLNIIAKIDAKKPSAANREGLYKEVFAILDDRLKNTTDIKERKIVQYIRNHVYIQQQEEKTGK